MCVSGCFVACSDALSVEKGRAGPTPDPQGEGRAGLLSTACTPVPSPHALHLPRCASPGQFPALFAPTPPHRPSDPQLRILPAAAPPGPGHLGSPRTCPAALPRRMTTLSCVTWEEACAPVVVSSQVRALSDPGSCQVVSPGPVGAYRLLLPCRLHLGGAGKVSVAKASAPGLTAVGARGAVRTGSEAEPTSGRAEMLASGDTFRAVCDPRAARTRLKLRATSRLAPGPCQPGVRHRPGPGCVRRQGINSLSQKQSAGGRVPYVHSQSLPHRCSCPGHIHALVDLVTCHPSSRSCHDAHLYPTH